MVRVASLADRKLVVEILSEAFKKNPGAQVLLQKKGDKEKQMKILIHYIFYECLGRKAIYISNNNRGVACCYTFNQKYFSFMALFYKIKMILCVIGITQIIHVAKREKYRIKQRPIDRNYLYFWFFGVIENGDRAAWELVHEIFRIADTAGKEIYAETTLKRNRIIYERFGFETYHELVDERNGLTFWFLKRKPKIEQ